MKKALFPGTFDPFTIGHASIVRRGLEIFDQIVIAVGINAEKSTYFTMEERLEHLRACYGNDPRILVCTYKGMTVDCAKAHGANAILRGVRSLTDFEYERLLSDINLRIAGINTVCLFTEPELASVQSNVVRDLLKHHQDVSSFIPDPMVHLLKK